MQQNFKSSRSGFDTPESLLIEALSLVAGTADQFQPIAFRGAQVASVHGVTENTSALLLQSGIIIPVALPFKELKRQIYEPDIKTGNHLDLTPVTGKTVDAVHQNDLSLHFKTVSPPPPKPETPLKISTFIERRNGGGIILALLEETDIVYMEVHSGDPKKTYLKPKSGSPLAKSGREDCYINLPLAVWQQKIIEAKRAKVDMLDLTEETRRKDPRSLGFKGKGMS